jgi:hypothetical protein
MSKTELDKMIEGILQKARKPMTVPQIERQVAEQGGDADTFDVQRSVRRLVETGRVVLTQRLDVSTAAPSE